MREDWIVWLQVALLVTIAGAAALWAGDGWLDARRVRAAERARLEGILSLRERRQTELAAFRESHWQELTFRREWDADLNAAHDAVAAGTLLDRLAADHGVSLAQRGAPRDLVVAGRPAHCVDVRVRGEFRLLVAWTGAVQGNLRAARWLRLAIEPEADTLVLQATLAFPGGRQPVRQS